MKQNSWLFLSPFAFVLVFSCKNIDNSQKTDKINNKNITTNTTVAKTPNLDSLEKQVFIISTDSMHFLVGKEGGVILVHPQSFIDETGKPIQGKIDIEFREAQTAGAYFVGVSQNNKALQVNPKNEGLFVAIPALKKDTTMRFFVDEKTTSGNINWKLDASTKETKLDAPKPPMQELAEFKLSLNDKLLADEYNNTKDFLDGIKADYVQKGNEYVPKVGNSLNFKVAFVENIRKKHQVILLAKDYLKSREKFLQQKTAKFSIAWDNYNKLNQAQKDQKKEIIIPTFYEYHLDKTGWISLK